MRNCRVWGTYGRGKRTGGRVKIFALFFFLLHIFAGNWIRRHFFLREGGRTLHWYAAAISSRQKNVGKEKGKGVHFCANDPLKKNFEWKRKEERVFFAACQKVKGEQKKPLSFSLGSPKKEKPPSFFFFRVALRKIIRGNSLSLSLFFRRRRRRSIIVCVSTYLKRERRKKHEYKIEFIRETNGFSNFIMCTVFLNKKQCIP